MTQFEARVMDYNKFKVEIFEDLIIIKNQEISEKDDSVVSEESISFIPELLPVFVKFINEIPNFKKLDEELYYSL